MIELNQNNVASQKYIVTRFSRQRLAKHIYAANSWTVLRFVVAAQ
jgi:hypothetical protein